MEDNNASTTEQPKTLPQPRKISAELNRQAFARSNSSSMSKSFASDITPVIKRSSDMVIETRKASRGERSLSFDTQTPYFCRQAQIPTKEETSGERRSSMNDIGDIEKSADVIAMKTEIAEERSKLERGRQRLSETINEIDGIKHELDNLIIPKDTK